MDTRSHWDAVGSRQRVCAVLSHSVISNPLFCSPPDSSVHGILQARILEGVAISFSKGSLQPRDQTQVSCIAGGFFTIWATREAPDRGSVSRKKPVRSADQADIPEEMSTLFPSMSTVDGT